METRGHYVLIGAFVLGIASLALLAVLWLGKHSLDREFDFYEVYFQEAVTGLAKGSPVQYNGIQIGEVQSLRLSRVNPGRVIARIRVRGGSPIKTDTEAKLGYLGVTGVAFIQLSGGTVEADRLRPRPGREFAVIRAQPSDLAKLFESGADIVVTVNEVLQRVSAILSEENAGRLSSAIEGLNRFTSAVAAEGDAIGVLLRDGARSATELAQTLAEVRSTVQTLERTIADTRGLIDGEAREALASLGSAASELEALLTGNRGAIDNFAQNGLGELTQVMAELRAVLVTLQAITRELRDNPSGYLLGRERPREYTPK
jgi:phospholipid/cholesterol/gamma-HCH transport system substrate-binding protein